MVQERGRDHTPAGFAQIRKMSNPGALQKVQLQARGKSLQSEVWENSAGEQPRLQPYQIVILKKRNAMPTYRARVTRLWASGSSCIPPAIHRPPT